MLYQVPSLLCAIEREAHIEVMGIFILLVDHQAALQLREVQKSSASYEIALTLRQREKLA